MSLDEHLQQQKKIIVRRYPSAEALAQVEIGKKFIVVQDDFDPSFVPQGYTLIDMKHKNSSFKTLVPQSLLFYMANPGEGEPEGALEEIADFYGETKGFEDDLIENGDTSVQEANWANLARGSYHTYLVNRLVKHRKGERDVEGEPVPEFNPEVLAQLDLSDPYVSQRVKVMAALALEKTADQIKTHDVKDVLKHVTLNYKERVKRKELTEVKCWAGSHYKIKHEYRTVDGIEERQETYSALNTQIGELESQIDVYRKQKHSGNVGRHDGALIRQYVNLAHIIPENPRAQLDISPPEKISEEQK
ncbi:MAG: hypothetical protein G01um101477_628 [Candidatus Doudnabacteria bacterium Gr01-1014_77]|uniref:Uncharacterized protein n=1 Tax=Candidatus Doudnabacteria bacterium Gr01-1014_77 TaxID=2017133 RepID=A0A554J9P7_9BACT|nr:MAG: hypothetical protein G01um101477_628 [Candidatus Doudnabacteria bacterium Gr01-1014_77]